MKYKLGERVIFSSPITHISTFFDKEGNEVIEYTVEDDVFTEDQIDSMSEYAMKFWYQKEEEKPTLGMLLHLLPEGTRVVLFDMDYEEIFHGDERDCPDELKEKAVFSLQPEPWFNEYSHTVYVEMTFTLEV